MKRTIALIVITQAIMGCGLFTTGKGTFTGRLVDVSWEGLIFKSCEVSISRGEQGSQMAEGSSLDPALCAELVEKSGQTVTVKYQSWVGPCCLRTDSPHEITEIAK